MNDDLLCTLFDNISRQLFRCADKYPQKVKLITNLPVTFDDDQKYLLDLLYHQGKTMTIGDLYFLHHIKLSTLQKALNVRHISIEEVDNSI